MTWSRLFYMRDESLLAGMVRMRSASKQDVSVAVEALRASEGT